jgi:hypothetical protein
VNPPAKIDDPDDKKPADWVDEALSLSQYIHAGPIVTLCTIYQSRIAPPP